MTAVIELSQLEQRLLDTKQQLESVRQAFFQITGHVAEVEHLIKLVKDSVVQKVANDSEMTDDEVA